MRAYGHNRFDKLECKFGCCTGKSGRRLRSRHLRDKVKRKTARQAWKKGN